MQNDLIIAVLLLVRSGSNLNNSSGLKRITFYQVELSHGTKIIHTVTVNLFLYSVFTVVACFDVIISFISIYMNMSVILRSPIYYPTSLGLVYNRGCFKSCPSCIAWTTGVWISTVVPASNSYWELWEKRAFETKITS